MDSIFCLCCFERFNVNLYNAIFWCLCSELELLIRSIGVEAPDVYWVCDHDGVGFEIHTNFYPPESTPTDLCSQCGVMRKHARMFICFNLSAYLIFSLLGTL